MTGWHWYDNHQSPRYFSSQHTFIIYSKKLTNSLHEFFQFIQYPEITIYQFATTIIKIVNHLSLLSDINHRMLQYDNLINDQTLEFKDFHYKFMEFCIVILEIDKNYDEVKRPISYFINQLNQPIHIFVDGLNFFANIMKALTNSDFHQFETATDIMNTFEHAIDFFDKVIPHGSTIHFIFKSFGSESLWTQFNVQFEYVFINHYSKLNHSYTMQIAIPYLSDNECDDRLVVKLAIECQKINNKVHVLTNDAYVSMPNHWHKPSLFKTKNICDNIINIINDSAVTEISLLSYIRFNFKMIDGKMNTNYSIN